MVTLFGVGLLIGGVLTATALAVLAAPVQAFLGLTTRWLVVGCFAVALLLRALGYLRFPLPENRRLVPETVFLSGRTWPFLQFGIEMGSGVRTFLPSALPYLLAVAVVCAASPVQAWAAGAGFGVGRAAMTWGSVQRGDPSVWRAAWLGSARVVVGILGVAVAVSLAALGAHDVVLA